jgi:protein TonB
MIVTCTPLEESDSKGVLPFVLVSIILHIIIIAYTSTLNPRTETLIALSDKDSIIIFENVFIEEPSAPTAPSTPTAAKPPVVPELKEPSPAQAEAPQKNVTDVKLKVKESKIKLPVAKEQTQEKISTPKETDEIPPTLKKITLTATRVTPDTPLPIATTSTEDKSLGGNNKAQLKNTNSYINALTSIIRNNIYYPLPAERTDTEGDVLLGIYVQEDGSITGIRVVKSSGYGILDRAAVKIAHSSSPLPPPPYGALAVEVSLVFSLQNQ